MKERINLTLDKDIKDKIRELSDKKGMSISAYLTFMINVLYNNEDMNKVKSDLQADREHCF